MVRRKVVDAQVFDELIEPNQWPAGLQSKICPQLTFHAAFDHHLTTHQGSCSARWRRGIKARRSEY